jgi:hypothetical protein
MAAPKGNKNAEILLEVDKQFREDFKQIERKLKLKVIEL